MSSRVLIADDSKTIQKVISITLANSGYELSEVQNEGDLLQALGSDQFDLVLLDFSLSEKHTGYELAKIVKEKMPSASIIAMLGTFDPFDDHQAEACGISDKIVKPFESSKFVKKCQEVLESSRATPMPRPTPSVSPKVKEEKAEDFDSWQVEAPRIYVKEEEKLEAPQISDSLDPLSSEMQGWGFSTKVNLEEKYHKAFPPVIEDVQVEPSPVGNFFTDGDYINSDQESIDSTDPAITVPIEISQALASEIDEEISSESFWGVDDVKPIKAIEAADIGKTNLHDITADLTEKVEEFRKQESPIIADDKFSAPIEETPKVASSSTVLPIDQEELIAKLKHSLRPMIEELVKEYCRQSAEKVAWEVIPDLAENLIRKEIKSISDSI